MARCTPGLMSSIYNAKTRITALKNEMAEESYLIY